MHDGLPVFRSAARASTTPSASATVDVDLAALGTGRAAKQKGEQRQGRRHHRRRRDVGRHGFEALNNAGVADADLLVIPNDNDMSISPPVGR